MSHHSPPLLLLHIILLLFSLLPAFLSLPVLPNPNPNPNSLQSFHPNPNPSQPITIPSFPEQSALSGCPLHLPDPLFPAVKSSCTGQHPGQLPNHAQCCPVLASWLYSAYSTTALRTNSNPNTNDSDNEVRKTTSLEMPDLPDDSETCVDALENVMRDKGLNLVKPNETCDVVYCYCGIRLHPLTCSSAFRVDDKGEIVGDSRVDSLERHCLSSGTGTKNRLARCSKCLHSLYSLKKSPSGSGNATRSEGRTEKMRGRDCELMGLTWLLNKDRDAYMSTVTSVMRVLMLNPDSPDPLSCSLSSDGLPLAVDSVEIDGQSSSVALHFSLYLYICLFVPLIMYLSSF
ncbi:putative GPI-anchored protein At4g28100 [Silene latifolia]|uniref:putative GPI-anchored protein At4g28100 n=1 Tax=Silene latifolia TaxID=37657 RepID=UPI003D78522C